MHADVKKYIDTQPAAQKEILLKVRDTIQAVAPEAEEVMSYGVPAFKFGGQTVMYAAFKQHLGLYPQPSTIEAFKAELSEYETSKGAIKFPLSQPIPYDLIARLVQHRLTQH